MSRWITKWRNASIAVLPLTIPLAVIAFSRPHAVAQQPLLAQAAVSTSFALPQTVEAGTKVTIDGSTSAESVSNNLKQQFESQYPGTQVAIAAGGSDAALQALKAGQIDLAALGRPLTEAEKAEGLIAVPVGRTKIAMIVGPGSPFKGSLTIEQFAKIFRGEVTNWSQVGGPSAPVRIVDRPDSSDTRQAFPNYPVFQAVPFKLGAQATRVDDTTSAVAAKLGTDGLGYAIADQAAQQPNVRIIQMHGTLPDDPRYPFSQPLFYVYKGPQPSPAARAFLGYALTPESQRKVVVQVSPAPAVTPSVPVDASPSVEAASPTSPGYEPIPAETGRPASLSPLWWLLLPALGLPLLVWFLKGRRSEAPGVPVAAAATAAATAGIGGVVAAKGEASRIVLTPRNCRDAYAYWELSDEMKVHAQEPQRNPLMLRLYDVTGVNLERQKAHSMKQFEIRDGDVDRHLPIELDDRDYLVDLGYISSQGEWVQVARSQPARVPKCTSGSGLKTGIALTGTAAAATAAATALVGKNPALPIPDRIPVEAIQDRAKTAELAVGTTVAAAGAAISGATVTDAVSKSVAGDRAPLPSIAPGNADSQIILVPRHSTDAYAYWEASDSQKAALRSQGGEKMALRLYDVTDISLDTQPPHSVYEYQVSETDSDRHLPIRVSDRDYLVELGYLTDQGTWLKLARSQSIRVNSEPSHSVVS